MPFVELSDEEARWIGVAIANCKESAKRLARDPFSDIDDQLDAGKLIQVWTLLEEKFPEPELGLAGD